ncbi:nuclear associated protein, putative [Eimeria necatrix]|uniref:Nuclear associated protein, putative n=1 Tax=Eimeria necatrix TaxID=51315 RepID=U6N389_9EIME|nr:nuclear associated protein, putative [Eimeria necatrix]CDJ68410.1 nuclear associated protein, putative [Eimeria necatrix]
MELEEIIKPYTLAPEPPKRPGAEAGPAAKRHLGDAAAAAAAAAGGAAAAAAAEAGGALAGSSGKVSLEDLPDEIDANAVEKILEQADEMHVEEITEASIKRCAAQLERRIKKNQHDRIKFANNPEK